MLLPIHSNINSQNCNSWSNHIFSPHSSSLFWMSFYYLYVIDFILFFLFEYFHGRNLVVWVFISIDSWTKGSKTQAHFSKSCQSICDQVVISSSKSFVNKIVVESSSLPHTAEGTRQQNVWMTLWLLVRTLNLESLFWFLFFSLQLYAFLWF